MPESEVMDLPLDKFYLYVEANKRERAIRRRVMVADTTGAISGALVKGALKKYLDLLERGEDK